MIREHKIPTLLGFFILVLGLVGGVFLVQKGQIFFLKAAPEITPTQVKITNVSASSFSLSWLTEKETNGLVKFGETPNLEQTSFDDRDQIGGQTGLFLTHHVTLRNLKPKTRYFFKIVSQTKIFDKAGKPYEITTASLPPDSPPPSDVASGRVFQPDKTPAEGAIVFLSLANVTPQSTLVRSEGTWFIPLNTAYSANLTNFATYDKEAQVEEILVLGGGKQTSSVLVTTGNDNPVPEIILGKNYDFRQKLSPEEITPTPTLGPIPESQTPPSSKFSFEEVTPPRTATISGQLTITNPGKEGEEINTLKPEFQGTGPKGKIIQILVESPQLSGKVTVKTDGSWTWIPPTNLSPGEHKITASFPGETVSRTFTVLAAGTSEMPAFTATPSATLTPTPPKITTPTPTATPAARTAMPSTEAGIPQPGYLTPTFFLFIMGLILILSGFVIKSRLTG